MAVIVRVHAAAAWAEKPSAPRKRLLAKVEGFMVRTRLPT